MPKKRFSAEQIVVLLRQIEVLMSQGKTAPIACREAGISQQCQRRSKNASASPSENTSIMVASRGPRIGGFSLEVKAGWNYPPGYRCWQGVSVACFD